MDDLKQTLFPRMDELGFRHHQLVFNRTVSDDLVQVIELRVRSRASFGNGIRPETPRKVAIAVGVYVPEVAVAMALPPPKRWVHEQHCSIRMWITPSGDTSNIKWWETNTPRDRADISDTVQGMALEFLDRFATREQIAAELKGETQTLEFCLTPRIVSAVLLAQSGQLVEATKLLAEQYLAAKANPTLASHVRRVTMRINRLFSESR